MNKTIEINEADYYFYNNGYFILVSTIAEEQYRSRKFFGFTELEIIDFIKKEGMNK